MALERGGGEGGAIVTHQTNLAEVRGEAHRDGQTVASWVVPRWEDAAPEDRDRPPVEVEEVVVAAVHTSSLV